MQLRSHKVTTRPNDRIEILAFWRNRFRKTGKVELRITKESEFATDNILVEGDQKDVSGVIFGLAEIAWNMGWRPEGFVNTVMNTVTNHKIPKKGD